MYLQAGGGIVHDSDPTEEYEESMNKVRVMCLLMCLTVNAHHCVFVCLCMQMLALVRAIERAEALARTKHVTTTVETKGMQRRRRLRSFRFLRQRRMKCSNHRIPSEHSCDAERAHALPTDSPPSHRH